MKISTFLTLTAACGIISSQSNAWAQAGRQQLGIDIINNGNISLYTGFGTPNSHSLANIQDTADCQPAHTSSYSDVGDTQVWLHTGMLQALKTLATTYGYSFRVTAIAGGDHSANSYHYRGTAFDVDLINGVPVSGGAAYWQTFLSRCQAMGAVETLGPGDAGHDTHIHAAWPAGTSASSPGGCVPAPTAPPALGGARSIPYKGDYTGDGHPDYVVWRPTTGNWHVKNSATLATYTVTFGAANDIPCPGDYKGDASVDYVVRRPSNATFYVKENGSGLVTTLAYGAAADLAVPGNYKGDAKSDYALFRPSTGTWYIKENPSLVQTVTQFGAVGDIAVAADYSGDGKADYAVFRPSTGTWYIKDNVSGAVTSVSWGMTGDVPAPGDYNADGRADYVVWRPSTGTWYVKFSSTLVQFSVSWGQLKDIPVCGVNFQGGANADYVVWRPSSGTFYVKKYSDGSTYGISWGMNGDYPLP